MKRFIPPVVLTSLLLSIFALALLGGCAIPTLQKMSIADLNTQLNDPGITIIDVRDNRDWQKSTLKIRGAVREDPMRVASWAGKYTKDARLVLY